MELVGQTVVVTQYFEPVLHVEQVLGGDRRPPDRFSRPCAVFFVFFTHPLGYER